MKKKEIDDKNKIEEDENKSKLTLFIYVVLISGIIFIVWFFTLPYSFSKIKEEGIKNKKQGIFFNEDTEEILANIKESFKLFGKKIKEVSGFSSTSTEEKIFSETNGTSTQEKLINDMKNKILEKTKDE